MKYIHKPEPLRTNRTEDNPDGFPFPVEALIAHLIDTEAAFNRTGKGIRMAMRIESALREAADADCIKLEDSDHEALAKAAAEPENGYPLRPARAVLPLLEAIEKASSEPPQEQAQAAE